LILIFDKLPLGDLLQCSVVSKSWFNIINNNLKLRNKIQLKLNEKTFNEYSQLDEKNQRTHLSLTIKNMCIKDCPALSFTSIRHLWLEFCTVRSVQNVKRLIEDLPNLETFKFRPTYNEKVVGTLLPSDKISSGSRSLNYFEITMFPEVTDPDNAWNVMRCFELIPMEIHKIHIKLFCGKDVTQAENLKTIFSYIDEKHRFSVRKLTFLICKSDVIRAVYENLVKLKHIQLDELEINGSLADNFLGSINFLQNQKSLKHLTTLGLPLIICPRSNIHWICENLLNLVTLNLDCGKLTEIALDKLITLENLRLFFSQTFGNISITVPVRLRTIQIESEMEIDLIIPREMENMEKLSLIYCKLTPMVLKKAVQNMPNLKTCKLCFISKDNDSKISSYLLPWKNVRKFVLPPWMMVDLVLFSVQSRELKTLDIEFGFELVC
jgi:F-box domain